MKGMDFAAALASVVAAVVLSAAGQTPAVRTIVINEVELNPGGLDRNGEWIEVLNLGTDTIDLAGWSLTYNYPLDGRSSVSEQSLALRPGERYVFHYAGLRLRNDAFTIVRLLNAAGAVIDETPVLSDTRDDRQTWQRIPDGGDPLLPIWLFLNGTMNERNS